LTSTIPHRQLAGLHRRGESIRIGSCAHDFKVCNLLLLHTARFSKNVYFFSLVTRILSFLCLTSQTNYHTPWIFCMHPCPAQRENPTTKRLHSTIYSRGHHTHNNSMRSSQPQAATLCCLFAIIVVHLGGMSRPAAAAAAAASTALPRRLCFQLPSPSLHSSSSSSSIRMMLVHSLHHHGSTESVGKGMRLRGDARRTGASVAFAAMETDSTPTIAQNLGMFFFVARMRTVYKTYIQTGKNQMHTGVIVCMVFFFCFWACVPLA
jgi:hypothetical protein